MKKITLVAIVLILNIRMITGSLPNDIAAPFFTFTQKVAVPHILCHIVIVQKWYPIYLNYMVTV